MTAAAPPRLRWAEVDLDAIRANVATLRALIPPPTRLAAVVKADAYGHGAVPVARAVLEGGAEWLTVATAAEALELRAAGIGAPVLLMGAATPAELGELIAAGVSLSVSDREGIEAAAGAVAGRRATVTGRPGAGPAPGAAGAAAERAMLHLKLDTGMHRLGAEAGAGLDLARLIQASPGLRLEALWTHFAEADDPTSGRTGTQLGAFLAAAARIDQAGLAGGAA
ncbi:MAG TPA: alanine racemase, partial [Candidatus Dormibacteraeota bacterium]|nr:alanine racemase [Candidatus Dormibacteraeota bacterium]